MVRMLAITPEAQAKADAVVSYAKDHPSVIRDQRFIGGTPGDNPNHVTHLDDYRCVFTITQDFHTRRIFRDLSISIPVAGKLPNPYAAYEIAKMFGFTGWDGRSEKIPEGWFADVMKEDNCIRLAQEIEK